MKTYLDPAERLRRSREKVNAYHAEKRDLTADAAFKGELWTEDEDREVTTSKAADHLIALKLGRTFSGVRARRRRLAQLKRETATASRTETKTPDAPERFVTVAFHGEIGAGYNGSLWVSDKNGRRFAIASKLSWGHFKGAALTTALTILVATFRSTGLSVLKSRSLADPLTERFAREVVAKLPNSQPFTLPADEVQKWITAKLAS